MVEPPWKQRSVFRSWHGQGLSLVRVSAGGLCRVFAASRASV